jgi:hypothetical protein
VSLSNKKKGEKKMKTFKAQPNCRPGEETCHCAEDSTSTDSVSCPLCRTPEEELDFHSGLSLKDLLENIEDDIMLEWISHVTRGEIEGMEFEQVCGVREDLMNRFHDDTNESVELKSAFNAWVKTWSHRMLMKWQKDIGQWRRYRDKENALYVSETMPTRGDH